MTKNLIKALVTLMVGVGIGYYLLPAKTVEVERIVEKRIVETETQIKEVVRPDGTKETSTVIVEVDKRQKDSENSKLIENKKPDYMVGLMVGKNLDFNTTVGIKVDRRIFSNFFAGGYVTTNKEIGLSLSYEF